MRRRLAGAASLVLGMAKGAVSPHRGFRVLMYHAVGTPIPEDRLGIYTLAPNRFARQMRALSEKFTSVDHFFEVMNIESGVAITFDDGYRDVLHVAAPVLADLGFTFTVFATSGYVLSGERIYLSPMELRELAQVPGVTIGSHGASHCRLTECSGARLREELVNSRSCLEDILQCPVNTLSYPHGAVDKRVKEAAQDAGYVLAACSRFGTNMSDRDPFQIKRTDIWNTDGLSQFHSKLAGGWDWMGWRT